MLPDGISLGRLQGPLSALASISPRFTGAVRIRPGDGVHPHQAELRGSVRGHRGGLPLRRQAYRYLLDRPSFDYELIAPPTRWGRPGIAGSGCLISGDGKTPHPEFGRRLA